MNKLLYWGIALLVCGIIGLVKGIFIDRKGVHYRATVQGFVVEDGNRFPVLSFVVNGNEVTMRGGNADSKNKYREGDQVEIICRSTSARYVNIVGENFDIMLCAAMLALGILVSVASFFVK